MGLFRNSSATFSNSKNTLPSRTQKRNPRKSRMYKLKTRLKMRKEHTRWADQTSRSDEQIRRANEHMQRKQRIRAKRGRIVRTKCVFRCLKFGCIKTLNIFVQTFFSPDVLAWPSPSFGRVSSTIRIFSRIITSLFKRVRHHFKTSTRTETR